MTAPATDDPEKKACNAVEEPREIRPEQGKHGGQRNGRVDGRLCDRIHRAQPFRHRQSPVSRVRKVDAGARGVDHKDDAKLGYHRAYPEQLGEAAIAHGQHEDSAEGLAQRRRKDGINVGRHIRQHHVEDKAENRHDRTRDPHRARRGD